jgi:hypothetical protein
MTVPRSTTNRVPLQYHGNHLYFSISKPRIPGDDALLALGPFVRGAAGQAVIGRIRALIKGRSPATYTSDAPSERPLFAHCGRTASSSRGSNPEAVTGARPRLGFDP